jgi:hypothetical protein
MRREENQLSELNERPRAAVCTFIAAQRYNESEMSRLFESFDYLDRGWDVRMLESQSLRSVFVWLLILTFVLGAGFALTAYQVFQLHRFNWLEAANLLLWGVMALRYSRLVYRRLRR